MDDGTLIRYHVVDNDEKTPKIGDVVVVRVIQSIGDSVIYNSSVEENGVVKYEVTEPIFTGDMMAGILNMHLHDSATIMFPIDSLCLKVMEMNTIPDFFTSGEPLFIDIKIEEIIPAEQLLEERKQELKLLKQNDDDRLSYYYSDVNNVIIKDGLVIVDVKGEGRGPNDGEIIRCHFSMITLDGDTLFYFIDTEPLDIICGDDYLGTGFAEAMRYVPEGGEGVFVIPSSLAFDSIGFSNKVKPYSSFIVNVKNIAILSLREYEQERQDKKIAEREAGLKRKNAEPALIESFVRKHNITVEPSATGVYFLEIERGSGSIVKLGDLVSIHYNLYNLDDKLIETSFGGSPLQFIIGTNDMLPGIEEAVLKMRVGGKATIILPSKMAFDSIPISKDLPTYSPVVFDIELIGTQSLR
ncbi:MAG: FKBP-type peptidyl-prolyl cis-trans isomerase [Candidatus Limimorpha sp.]